MPKKILVVDDEPKIVKIVAFRLNEQGYQVITASDGQEALRKARQERPDLIILDIMIPKGDGGAVAEALRQDPQTMRIPILFLTSLVDGQQLELEGHTIAGNLFLAKPIDSNKLLSLVAQALQQPSDRPSRATPDVREKTA